jgi:hypothetical protein
VTACNIPKNFGMLQAMSADASTAGGRLWTSDEDVYGITDAQLAPNVCFVRKVDTSYPSLLAFWSYEDQPLVWACERGVVVVGGITGHGLPPDRRPRTVLGGPVNLSLIALIHSPFVVSISVHSAVSDGKNFTTIPSADSNVNTIC